jgi:hypothetical protein
MDAVKLISARDRRLTRLQVATCSREFGARTTPPRAFGKQTLSVAGS